MDVVRQIEEAFVGHWSVFGRWSEGRLVEERGILRFETPIEHLPYNGVIRTQLDDADPDAAIAEIVDGFGERGVQFFWLVHPSARPVDLGERLEAHGLRQVETATGMSLDLEDWKPRRAPEGVEFREVLDDADMDAYLEVTTEYWEIPERDSQLVGKLHREWRPGVAPGHRYLALIEGRVVGKGYLSLAAPPRVAAIYGMSTRPEARGRGVASGLTNVLIARAKELGRTRLVLHSSDMAVGIYAKAGFVERCRFTVFATAPLWSHGH